MKKILLTTLSAAICVSACASNPNKMTASYVSPNIYGDYDCKQITTEQQRILHRTDELYTQLRKDADNDAWQMGVGLVLLWPVLFFLEGGDGPEAVEYKRLKGEYEALEKASNAQRCDLLFKSLVPTASSVKTQTMKK